MVATLLFAGITSLLLCLLASLAEDFLPHNRKAFLSSPKSSSLKKTAGTKTE